MTHGLHYGSSVFKCIRVYDTKEGSMALRLAESMRLKPNEFNIGKSTGHIAQSTGVRDGDSWGKRAAWCDYSGLVNSTFGVHDFEKKPKGTGNLTIPAGESITFRYRIYMYEGDEKQGDVARQCEGYISEL